MLCWTHTPAGALVDQYTGYTDQLCQQMRKRAWVRILCPFFFKYLIVKIGIDKYRYFGDVDDTIPIFADFFGELDDTIPIVRYFG